MNRFNQFCGHEDVIDIITACNVKIGDYPALGITPGTDL
jgi:hypothetical protein